MNMEINSEINKLNLSVDDFPNICRLCLLSNDSLPVMSPDEIKFYKIITDIKIAEDDKLPRKVCQVCVKELDNVSCFIQKCKENETILSTILVRAKQRSPSPICNKPDCVLDSEESHLLEQMVIKIENEVKYKEVIKSEEEKVYVDPSKNVEDITRPKNFHCANCGNEFYTKGELVVHMNTHSETKPFFCPDCNMRFKFCQSLQRHMLIHNNMRGYECDICGKRFKRALSRNQHRKVHNRAKVRPTGYACTQCDRILASRSALSGHRKTHTRVNPYPCSYCGKRFPYVSKLTVHTRLHTGETPFICLICNKGYQTSSGLKKHEAVKHCEIARVKVKDDNENGHNQSEKTFQEKKCKICNKILQKRGFSAHMRMHTVKKKKFMCTICNKSFQDNSRLERHIRLYTDKLSSQKILKSSHTNL